MRYINIYYYYYYFCHRLHYILQLTIAGSLVEVSVDVASVPVLWELGLPAACPNVQKIELVCYKTVGSDIITTVCSAFTNIIEVAIRGKYSEFEDDDDPWPSMSDPASFCNALVSSCPQLAKLSITDLDLEHGKTGDILRGSMALEHLTAIT